MTTSLYNVARTSLAILMIASSLVACELGSYDEAVKKFNQNAPPPPPPPPDPPPDPPPPGASFGPNFSEIQSSVFTPTCATANCHSAGTARAGLSLEDADSYAMLVGADSVQMPGTQLVNPGNPDMSYLITKLEGPGAMGQQMAPGAPLAQVDIDVIRLWITNGATDDRTASTKPIQVASVSPAPGANLAVSPTRVVVSFDREPDASTVNANTFLLEASGKDGTFGDGNELPVTAVSVTVPPANPRSAVFDLTGIELGNDVYRITLPGSGASILMDLDANALHGDSSSTGIEHGADFEAWFVVTAPTSQD